MQINEPSWIVADFSDREVNWIFKSLNTQIKTADTITQRRDLIVEFMKRSTENRKHVQHLRLKSESDLLSEEELEWIDRNNIRLLRWIMYVWFLQAVRSPIPAPDYNPASEVEFYDYFIGSVDQWKANLQEKRHELSLIKSAWSEKQLKDKQLAWLDKQNKSQIEWAWKYLKENASHYSNLNQFNPIKFEEMYVDILSIFDTWPGDTGPSYRLQTSMKQAWSQQKYRANLKNKNKKQSTYALRNETKRQLENLAKANNVNLNQMLEYIIDEAHKSFKKGKTQNHPEKDNES